MDANKDIEALIKTLKHSKDSETRAKAAEALEKIGDNRAVEPLIQALQDRDSYVRLRTVLALGALKEGKAVEPIIQVLKGDEEVNVRAGAAWVLGRIGDSSVTVPLINALRDESSQVRLYAAMALGLVGDYRAVTPLRKAMRDKNNNVREAAYEAVKWVADRIEID